MLNIIKNTINRVFASGVDSDASAFITATGLSGTTQKSAITTLVKDLKSSGLWSKMKAVYPMITDNYNQFYYSEDFSNANWYRINNTITTNSTTAPNGTLTADTFADNATNNFHEIAANYTLTGINGNNTASIYAKANTLNWICVTYYISGTYQKTFFDLQNGVVGTNASGNTATIENVGNGWYRCSITRNFNATGSFNVGFHTASADNVDSYAGSGQSLYIWGAQFQAGTPLAYQPIATTPSAFMASQMKYNLKDARDLDAAFRLTWAGGWTYSATGATPNGTNGYADTKLVASTAISSINSSHLSIYSRTDTASSPQGDMGAYTSTTTNAWTIAISYSDICYMGSYAFGMAINYNQFANANSTGYYINTRYAANSFKSFRNNELKATNTTLAGTLPTVSQYIGAENSNGTAVSFSNKQYAFATLGDGLSDSDALLLNQIVEKYQVALSRGVQAAQSFYYNSAYSNEANTYLYSTQITGTTQVSAINTLINGLKANNLWTKMKAVYPFVTDKSLQADMAAQMKFNLVNPQDTDAAFRLAFSGGWTYSTNGAQPNGTNGYADTKLNPFNTLSLNNTHISTYLRTNSDGAYVDIGNFNGVNSGLNIFAKLSNLQYARVNEEDNNTISRTDSRGYVIASRIISTSKDIYVNNVKTTFSKTSTSLVNNNVFIGAVNDLLVNARFFSNRQTSFATIGDGLSDAEALALYNLIQDFQTTLSRQV